MCCFGQLLAVCFTAGPVGNLQISHHTGALSFASLDQIMVLIAVVKLIRSSHRAKTKMPAFHDLLTIWNSGMTIRTQAMKFAMGTSGYVGSIARTWLVQVLSVNASLVPKLCSVEGCSVR